MQSRPANNGGTATQMSIEMEASPPHVANSSPTSETIPSHMDASIASKGSVNCHQSITVEGPDTTNSVQQFDFYPDGYITSPSPDNLVDDYMNISIERNGRDNVRSNAIQFDVKPNVQTTPSTCFAPVNLPDHVNIPIEGNGSCNVHNSMQQFDFYPDGYITAPSLSITPENLIDDYMNIFIERNGRDNVRSNAVQLDVQQNDQTTPSTISAPENLPDHVSIPIEENRAIPSMNTNDYGALPSTSIEYRHFIPSTIPNKRNASDNVCISMEQSDVLSNDYATIGFKNQKTILNDYVEPINSKSEDSSNDYETIRSNTLNSVAFPYNKSDDLSNEYESIKIINHINCSHANDPNRYIDQNNIISETLSRYSMDHTKFINYHVDSNMFNAKSTEFLGHVYANLPPNCSVHAVQAVDDDYDAISFKSVDNDVDYDYATILSKSVDLHSYTTIGNKSRESLYTPVSRIEPSVKPKTTEETEARKTGEEIEETEL